MCGVDVVSTAIGELVVRLIARLQIVCQLIAVFTFEVHVLFQISLRVVYLCLVGGVSSHRSLKACACGCTFGQFTHNFLYGVERLYGVEFFLIGADQRSGGNQVLHISASLVQQTFLIFSQCCLVMNISILIAHLVDQSMSLVEDRLVVLANSLVPYRIGLQSAIEHVSQLTVTYLLHGDSRTLSVGRIRIVA